MYKDNISIYLIYLNILLSSTYLFQTFFSLIDSTIYLFLYPGFICRSIYFSIYLIYLSYLYLGLTPAKLPDLVEYNPMIAIEILLKLMQDCFYILSTTKNHGCQHIGILFQGVLRNVTMISITLSMINKITPYVDNNRWILALLIFCTTQSQFTLTRTLIN